MLEGEASQESNAPESASASPPPDEPNESAVSGEAEATVASGEAEGGVASGEAEAVVSAESETAREAPVEAAVAVDWSHVRGFQTVEPAPEALAAREDYAEELAKELNVRAARFARSVDESIVLSSDGLLRWLGDPVARVVAGDKLLEPRAVLLADEALAGEERGIVENRLALWLAAHVRKVLGPLLALAEGAELPEAAKALGDKIAEALGVLDRETVRTEVRALDQNARGALRKLGVRFGSLYIYAPLLLKPGARSLSSMLWMLKRGAETGADRLLGFAAAGRTSFANEGLLAPDSYRVAGFRLCGERVVRVDIIERLSDLIRAAIPDHMRAGANTSDANGFLITPQMTSLTGCSGEAFASILRSLGFEPIKVSKAAFEAARPKAPMEPLKPVEPVAAAQGGEPVAEVPAGTEEGGETVPAAEAEPEATMSTVAEDAGEPVEAQPEIAAEEPVAAEAATEALAPEAGEAASPAEAETAVEAVGEAQAESALAVQAEPASVEPDEEIEIWRPAPRRPRAPRHAPGEERQGRPNRDKRQRHQHHGKPPEGQAASAEARPQEQAPRPPRPERRDEGQRRFEGRRDEGRRDENRDERRPPKAPPPPHRENRGKPVDPDSPFAKLAALRPLLERRDKRP